ncbi:hypothetical protein [Natronoarchaeum sp. GCM10025703]|uniref:hypothetical protein n=1 Tax=Natronoarchaeum sp. GCM10025703 TaxID=3252685 RepID=UPI00366C8653
MPRALSVIVGMLELLVPGRIVHAAERLALENPEGCEPRTPSETRTLQFRGTFIAHRV